MKLVLLENAEKKSVFSYNIEWLEEIQENTFSHKNIAMVFCCFPFDEDGIGIVITTIDSILICVATRLQCLYKPTGGSAQNLAGRQ